MLPAQGTLGNVCRDIFDCYNLWWEESVCHWHLITGNQGCCQAYYSAEDIPHNKKFTSPKMSIVLRLENVMLNNSRTSKSLSLCTYLHCKAECYLLATTCLVLPWWSLWNASVDLLSLQKSDTDGAMEDVDASVNTEKRRKAGSQCATHRQGSVVFPVPGDLCVPHKDE